MSNSSSQPTGPGWYADPSGRGGKAWWNGSAWAPSEYVPAGGQPSQPFTAPPTAAARPQYAQVAPARSAGASPYTWQIWIIVLLPFLPLIGLSLIDPTTLILAAYDPTLVYSDPGYIMVIAGTWIAYIGTIVLAFGDVRSLKRRGVDRPFHPAFIFLGPLIYSIGRSVVVKRQLGWGLTPIWASLGVWFVSGVASILLTLNLLSDIGIQ
ncbi:MAG: hypothetical protein ACOH14_07305 [Rhodoglobus sp.]